LAPVINTVPIYTITPKIKYKTKYNLLSL